MCLFVPSLSKPICHFRFVVKRDFSVLRHSNTDFVSSLFFSIRTSHLWLLDGNVRNRYHKDNCKLRLFNNITLLLRLGINSCRTFIQKMLDYIVKMSFLITKMFEIRNYDSSKLSPISPKKTWNARHCSHLLSANFFGESFFPLLVVNFFFSLFVHFSWIFLHER